MTNTIVTIGRGLAGAHQAPMSAEAWSAFKALTRQEVERYAGPVVFAGEGEGIWEGTYEQGYTVIGTQYGGTHLVHALRTLARWYDQEAIALTNGSPEFILPD